MESFYFGPWGYAFYRLSRWLALSGGFALLLLILVNCASVIGRTFFAAPLNGDFELTQLGIAFAIFSFFPWAHICRGHITIGFFIRSARGRFFCDMLADALFGLLGATLTSCLAIGGYSAYLNEQQSAVLALPLWWGFAAAILPTALLTLVCGYSAWFHYRRWIQSRIN